MSKCFRNRPITLLGVLLLGLVGSGGFLLGQDRLSAAQKQRLGTVTVNLPGDLLVQVRAVGDRMSRSGKEETVLEGELFGLGESKAVRVVHQLSGMVRIEGLRGGQTVPLTFDGDLIRGSTGRIDESILETFAMDTIEGMVYSVRSGGAMRLLGRGFGPNPRAVPDYKGPRFDIYEITAPVRTRQDRQLRFKRYYFDSDTGFLVSTRYTDPTVSPGIRVETRFLNWQRVDGSAYPGRIERYENGNPVFSFVVATASSRGRR